MTADGRPLLHASRSTLAPNGTDASALGRSTHYTLAYDYSRAPGAVSWSLVKGDITRVIDGGRYVARYRITSP